jgi:hypothetical protein
MFGGVSCGTRTAQTWPLGHISRRELKPGVWLAQVTYRDFAGVIRRYEARGSSGSEAQRRLEDRLHSLTNDAAADGLASVTRDTCMNDVFDQWIAEKRAEGQITPQSLTTYLGVLERDLRPALGALRVREVTPVAVNRVLMALSRAQKFDTPARPAT